MTLGIPDDGPAAGAAPTGRPAALWIVMTVAALLFVEGAASLAFVLERAWTASQGGIGLAPGPLRVALLRQAAVGLAQLGAAYGVFHRLAWGRIAALGYAYLFLVYFKPALATILDGSPGRIAVDLLFANYPIAIVAAFHLPRVRAVFGPARRAPPI